MSDKRLEEEIRRIISRFDAAVAGGDVQQVESLLADPYFHTDIYGVFQDKQSWLASWLRPVAAGLKAGDFRWEIYRSDEIQVYLMGDDVAIVVGRWTLKRSDHSAPMVGRFTHVWRRSFSGWKRVAYQATTVQAADSLH